MNAPRAWFEKDFYAVLGVPKGASVADIKRAFKKIAREIHPDRNPGDTAAEERMKEASEAYSVLSDQKRRAEYDQVRRMARGGMGGGGIRFEGGVPFDPGDIVGDLFGGNRRARRGRGADVEARVSLAFEDAARGTTVSVPVRRDALCSACGGTGDRSGRSTMCATCRGSGTVGEEQGMFSFVRACPACGGRGRVVTEPCRDCDGAGVKLRTEEVRVRIPPGIADGARVRVRGRGEAVAGAAPGDLFVAVSVAKHPLFGRKGSDLTLTVPVTFPQAALGATLDVPTMDGSVSLKVPAGAPSGRTFRVRGRGLKRARGGAGDLLVTIQVEVPATLTAEERELIEKLAAAAAANAARTGAGASA